LYTAPPRSLIADLKNTMLNVLEQIETELKADAVIIGGGLAGLAAAIHLTRGGLKVICLEPRETFPKIVGESLDWSAPQLFAQLGLPMEELVETGAATFKRHITITAADGTQQEFLPGAWLAERPWNVEVRTLHLDRPQIHTLLQETVRRQGTITLHERAVGFELKDGKIVSVETSSGRVLHARWIVDASGAAASVLGREFNLSSVSYGPKKVALWAHFPTAEWVEGTTLYTLSPDGQYMEWMWEIPIRPGVSSIGYVAPGSTAKLERGAGMSNADLLSKQMQKFPRLQEIARQSPNAEVASTSFLCRTYKGVCGPNWVIIGEAASQSDPITGNGVTAALRHAEEGSALICRYQHRGTIPAMAKTVYNLRVSGMGCYFNSLIEKLYYESPLRSRLGIFATARVYTVPAWLTNVVYSRSRPRRFIGTLLLCSAMLTLRAVAWGLFGLCSLLSRSSREAGSGKAIAPGATEPNGGAAEEAGRERPRALHTQR
jgi:2-polyprenyl-6-methoxyphenol hydroxylase-like FAD-dependent oxidoreductase